MPNLRCVFCFKSEFQLWILNFSLSVHLRSATFRQNLLLVPIFLHGIVCNILFVEFQGVGSVKCQIFSVSFLEQTLYHGLHPKFWGFSPFLGVNQIFSKFQCCQHSKNWIFMENKPKPCWWETYWKGGTAFSLQKFGTFNFQNPCRGAEITKVWILRRSEKFFLAVSRDKVFVPEIEFQGVVSVKRQIFSVSFLE